MGNEHFTNIPKDLFVGQKYNDEYGRIWIKDFEKPKPVRNESSKFLYFEECEVHIGLVRIMRHGLVT
ncbi:hypothetical protein [Chryseobacterium wanjuense]